MARGTSKAKRCFIAAEDKRAQAVDPFLDALLAEPPKPEILGANAAREALEALKRPSGRRHRQNEGSPGRDRKQRKSRAAGRRS